MCVRRKYNRRTIIRVRLWPTLLIHAVGPWFTVILMGLTSQPTCPRVLARRVPVQTSNKRHHTRSAHCDSVQTSHNRHHTRSAHRDSVYTSHNRHHTRSAHCDSVQTSHNRHHTRSTHRDSVQTSHNRHHTRPAHRDSVQTAHAKYNTVYYRHYNLHTLFLPADQSPPPTAPLCHPHTTNLTTDVAAAAAAAAAQACP